MAAERSTGGRKTKPSSGGAPVSYGSGKAYTPRRLLQR